MVETVSASRIVFFFDKTLIGRLVGSVVGLSLVNL
jgi:hypothetical protein